MRLDFLRNQVQDQLIAIGQDISQLGEDDLLVINHLLAAVVFAADKWTSERETSEYIGNWAVDIINEFAIEAEEDNV